MTPDLSGKPTQSIVVDYDLPQKPAQVWRALTDSALLATWLMPNDFRAELGYRFTFQAQPMPGFDGVIRCEVLELVPEKTLRYSWRGGSLDSVVVWTLSPSASGGSLLRLEHSGFGPADAFAFDGMGKGWRGNIATRLKQLLSQ